MSKAKISPLQYKGETTRNELAGATFAVRVKSWILEKSGLKFGDCIPFLDSCIVQAMIKKDSYGFNTFAGLRVAEIQQKSDVDSWRHLPSSENISDILTKGAKTDMIAQGSVTKTESKLSETEKDNVQKYLKSQKEACILNIEVPSGNFAIIAKKDTSKIEDFEVRYPIAKKALSEDSYVDNTFVTGKTIEGIRRKIEEINFVASHGGFKYKEWIVFERKLRPRNLQCPASSCYWCG